MATKRAAIKRTATKKSGYTKHTGGQTCWPGYKRVPGTRAGTKGSCAPKARQTAAEKRADSKAAAARKRDKAA